VTAAPLHHNAGGICKIAVKLAASVCFTVCPMFRHAQQTLDMSQRCSCRLHTVKLALLLC
jgi:hypothetical protein